MARVAWYNGAMVICIGGASVDLHAFAPAPLRYGTSNPGTVVVSAGGVARNVAENLARLGVPVALVTWLGADAMSRWIVDTTREAGVIVYPQIRGDEGSRYVSVLEAGEPAIAVSDFGPIEDVDGAEVNGVLDEVRDDLVSGDRSEPLILIADCNLPRQALWACLNWRAANNARLIVDPVSVAKMERLRDLEGVVDLIMPNRDEADALATWGAPWIAAWIVTRGSCGAALWINGSDRVTLGESMARSVTNATGAGDAATAAVAAAIHGGSALRDAMSWGIAAGAITVESRLAVSVDLSVDAIMKLIER